MVAGVLAAVFGALVFLVAAPWSSDARQAAPARAPSPGAAPGEADASAIPLHFEENVGQAPEWARFVARGGGPELLLGPGTVAVGGMRLQLLGAGSALEPRGGMRLAVRVDYFLGDDPDQWLTGVAAFGDVVYPDVYPGIGVRYHGDRGALEQDFIVSPGADARVIVFGFQPAAGLSIENGDLVVEAPAGSLRLAAPIAYQIIGGTRHEVDARFELAGDRVSFAVGSYDEGQELVIDPVISYASYLGGAMSDVGNGIAAEAGGRLFITGRTGSTDFPPGESDPPGNDAFLVAIDPAQSGPASLVYKAYLGGNNQDEGFGVAAGPDGTVYVTGKTSSADFPTVNAFDPTNNAQDAFLVKIDPSASGPAALVYSTFLGGTGDDAGAAVAVDAAGRAHVTGDTSSANEFPLQNAFDSTVGGTDGFLVKLDPAIAGAGGLLYGTYLGGDANDRVTGVAIDGGDKTLVVGETQSATGFPLANPYDGTLGGASDGFLAQLDTAAAGAASLLYSTYLGGAGADLAAGVAVGSGGRALVSGATASADFPVRSPLFGALGGAQDAFLAKLVPGLGGDASLAWSSFLGGAGADSGTGVASDPAGNAFVAGITSSADFPTTQDRVQGDQGDTDAFIVKIGESAGRPVLLYSSYVGGSAGGPVVNMPFDRANAVSADGVGSTAITGETFSLDVASSGPGFDTTCGSDGTCDGGANSDGWVTRTTFAANLGLTARAPKATAVGKPFNLELTIVAAGPDAATGVTLTSAAPSGVAIGAPVASQGACTTSGQTVTCNLGLMPSGSSATVVVPLTAGASGAVTLAPTVAAQEPDPDPADNVERVDVEASPGAVRPRLTLRTKRARVSAKGTVALKLRCGTRAPGRCKGRLTITSTKRLDVDRLLAAAARKRVVKFADRRYAIRKGKTRTLKVKLTKEGRAVVSRLGRLRVVVTVKTRDSAGKRATIRRKLTLKAARRS